jgi:8-oxo-dGTP pyrophosphatase MutT (NUDIX family)
MIAVAAAGGVVYQKKEEGYEVLLIHRNGVWDLPKGKQEEHESIEECARREVAEEVGIPLPEIECFLTKTYHEYERDGKKYGKTTHWYKMRTDVQDNFRPEESEGIETVEWTDIDEAERRVGYENLNKVLKAFKNTVK